MNDAEWPAPEPATPREPERRTTPLPRVEDLPIAEQGYDREKVREAFDAFYRHAAQLDATLSTLEAVEVFQRTSAELRAELRNIRGSGWTVQSWQGGTGYAGGGGTRGRVSEWTLPPSFPRLAAGVRLSDRDRRRRRRRRLVRADDRPRDGARARGRAAARVGRRARACDPARRGTRGCAGPRSRGARRASVGEGWVAPEEGPEALTMLDNEVVEVEADVRGWSPSRSRRSRSRSEAEPELEAEPRPRSWSPSRSPSRSRSRSPSPNPSPSPSPSRSRSRSPRRKPSSWPSSKRWTRTSRSRSSKPSRTNPSNQ